MQQRTGWLVMVALVLATFGAPRSAWADDRGFDPVWWRPVAGGEGTASGVVQNRGPRDGDLRTGVETTYSRRILVARDRDLEPARALIDQRATTWVLAALRVADPFELMLDQPLYLTQSYNESPLFDALDSPRSFGVGDTRVGGSLRLARSDRGAFRGFGVAAFVFAPLGRDRAFQGEPFRWEPRLWLDTALGPYTRATFNAAWMFRERQTIPGIEINDAFGWGVLFSHELGERFSLVAEADGQVFVDVDDFRPVHLPVEVRAGAALRVGRTTLTAGIGTGIVRGVGTSAVTANLQVRTDVDAITRDRDHDTIVDEDDTCPDDPEDIDLFEDEDGCPEADNDGDGIIDGDDGCPLVAEDFDDFDDVDGCPDPDNDGDGVVDTADNCVLTPNPSQTDVDVDRRGDACDDDIDGDGLLNGVDNCPIVANPRQEDTDGNGVGDACSDDRDGDGIPDRTDACISDPEDRDGFDDLDGCPEIDNDLDGLVDRVDQCPDVAEDPDLFEDTDGCPDLDNDGDGITDVVDECPNDPEDVDGDRDEDGCPDVDSYATMQGDRIVISMQINFEFNSSEITGEISFEILDDVAEILLANPSIEVRVEGHTDSQGTAEYNQQLSAGRADAVMRYLIGQGVARSRLESIGFGEEQPIADNATETGRALNRRVEFHIVRR